MLSEQDRQELIGLVAKECGTVLRQDDPIFASVVLSERVLQRAAGAVAERLSKSLRSSLAQHEERTRARVEEGVNAELRRLMEAGGRARAELRKSGRRWTVVLIAVLTLELFGAWVFQRGGWL